MFDPSSKGLHPFDIPGMIGVPVVSWGKKAGRIQGLLEGIIEFLEQFIELLGNNGLQKEEGLCFKFIVEFGPVRPCPLPGCGDVFESKVKVELNGIVV